MNIVALEHEEAYSIIRWYAGNKSTAEFWDRFQNGKLKKLELQIMVQECINHVEFMYSGRQWDQFRLKRLDKRRLSSLKEIQKVIQCIMK